MKNNLKAFFSAPYDDNMDWLQWFLFVGLIIVFMVAWSIIINTLKEATQ